ncbi:MAG: hypothetical protein EOP06_13370, partial [Proteobacteria bacterium]
MEKQDSTIEKSFQAQDFLKVLRKQSKLFAGIFTVIMSVAVLLYVFKIPYVGKGSLLINDSQNSSLQAFSTSYFGMAKSVVDGKKGNTQIGKQIEVLHTREFFNKFLEKIESRGQRKDLSVAEQQ